MTTTPEKQKLLNLPQKKPVFDFFKRLFDVFAAFFGLIILSPAFAVIAVMIKTQSEGRVFYKSTRLGKNGKPFIIWKFRTMVENADNLDNFLTKEQLEEFEKNFKLDRDPRITKIGEFLRKTALDELPQLINVLIGNMSLIGPRPIVFDEISKYGEYYNIMNLVPPGITGWWQVNTAKCRNYDDRVALDVYYVNNRSVKLDVVIVFKTVAIILKRKGSG